MDGIQGDINIKSSGRGTIYQRGQGGIAARKEESKRAQRTGSPGEELFEG